MANRPAASGADLGPPGAPEVIVSHSRRVKCDGGAGPLGHPVVYYTIGEEGAVECLYCDRRYVYEPGPDGGDDH